MKNITSLIVLATLLACNNEKKETQQRNAGNSTTQTNTTNTPPAPGAGVATITIDGKEISGSASALVSKDKDKLQPGADYIAMLTSTGGPNNESLTLNFVFDLKPGVYPVVGMSFLRGPSDNSEVYGGLLGGKPTITEYKVNLTECRDLGSNNLGGHKWSLSGTVEPLTIPAMGVMLMDKTKNHPAEIKLEKITFTNIVFDDNWEEAMEKAMKELKKD